MVFSRNVRGRPAREMSSVRAFRLRKQLVCSALFIAFAQGAAAQQVFTPNFGAIEQPTGDRSYRPSVEVGGQGVILATGNKIEVETDFVAQGEMALYLKRSYNSQWSATGIFGKHWISNFDYSLATSMSGSQVVVWIQRPDGRRIKFVPSGEANRWNEDKPASVAFVVRNSDGTYSLRNEDRGTEIYSSDGYILERKNEQGIAWTFSYTGKYLQRVTHSSGRYVQFTWTGTQLTQVLDTAGNPYGFNYDANVFGTGRGRLASVTLPGSPATTVSYHYEDARYLGALTGKSYNGARYSTYSYDANGRVASTELAGGIEHYTFDYAGTSTAPVTPPPLPPAPGGIIDEGGGGGWCEYQSGSRICFQPRSASIGGMTGFGAIGLSSLSVMSTTIAAATQSTSFSAIETNPLGKRTTYTFENDRLVSVTRSASSKSSEAYRERQFDPNGYEDLVSDFTEGLTDYDYDAHGHLTSRTDGSGTSAARTTLYSWDEATNRLISTTIVGVRETDFLYTPDGRVQRVDEKNLTTRGVTGAVKSTTYIYTKHDNGMLASVVVDGPLPGATDAISSTYNAYGDLVSVRNGFGHTTTYSGHNALGQVGRVVGPNGDQTDFEYDGRGRVIAVRPLVNGAQQATLYTYDGFGRLLSTQTPDGRKRNYVYDAAWRLAETFEREPSGLYARSLNSYDVASNPTQTQVRRSSFPPDTRVVGNIDGVVADGSGFAVRGWACSTGQDASISVHAYAGGGWPSGTLIGPYEANRASEPGVAAACAANGSAYRFQFPLTDAVREAHGGKAVYVHGISPAGKENSLIAGSGVHAIPRLLPNVAPGGLTAPAKSLLSTWTVSWSGGVPRATRYRLEESADSSAWTVVHDAAETSKAISGKGAGTYSYRVAGCNEVGCGPMSSPVSVQRITAPTSAPTPSAPAVNEDGAYTVSVSGVATATYYVIDESSNNGASWYQAHNGAGTSAWLTGRNSGIDYLYRSRACNEAGCGPTSGTITVQRAIYGAQFAGWGVFGLAMPGQTQSVTIYMRNTGNTTWTEARGYRLGSQNPGDNYTWGLNRVSMPGDVPPGGTAAFSFGARAPGSTGLYNFQWRMLREGVTWFGDQTPNVVVEVATGSISASPASCGLYIGQTTCSSSITWSSTRSDAQVWVTNLDGTGWQLFANGQSGRQTAPWITTSGTRFHVMVAGVSLSSVDVRAYQTGQYPPEPDPPPCPTKQCQEP